MQSIKKNPKIKRHSKDENQHLTEYRANRIKEKQMTYIENKIPFQLKKGCRHDGEMIYAMCRMREVAPARHS